MATRGREDRTREFFRAAEREFLRRRASSCRRSTTRRCGCWRASRPRRSTTTHAVRDWIDMFTMWPTKPTPGLRGQLENRARTSNRLPAYRNITAPVLVIGFADDVVLPPHLGREVADALPERPLPGDTRYRAPRLHRAARRRQRRGAGILRRGGMTGCQGEPIDDTGPHRRRRTDSRRRPRRRAVPGFAQRAAGVRPARRRPRRPAPAARAHRRAHRRLPGDRAGRRRRALRCAWR